MLTRKSRLFVLATLCLMPLMGCRSVEVVTEERTRVPDVVFPEFPLASEIVDNKDGTVTAPAEWIIELEEYRIRIEETEKNYNDLKEIYGE